MATLVRWEPLRDVAALQNEMSRMVNATFFNDGGPNGGESWVTALDDWGRGGTNGGKSWVTALDVWETDEEIVYAFDLPGLAEDAITIEFEDGGLTLSGDRERDEQ